MPLRHQPPTLRKASMTVIANHFEKLCYGCPTQTEMIALIDSEEYLQFEGPFVHMPSSVLEDMLEAISEKRDLHRKHLHILIQAHIQNLTLSFGIGDAYNGLEFMKQRCKNLKKLNISYLRHMNPNILMGLVPSFSKLVSLNLRMTLTVDQILAQIGISCPLLRDLNLASTPITDRGIVQLCVREDGQRQCQHLVRLIVAETAITVVGATVALQSLPNLREFDYEKIFDVMEIVERWDQPLEARLFQGLGVRCSAETSPAPSSFKLHTLVSTAEHVRIQGLDAAARLCPEIRAITMANAWVPSEALYKLMMFEHINSISLTNSEGLTLDFYEGVMPLLSVCGHRLDNLILANFTTVDVCGIGRTCPELKNLALSSVATYEPVGKPSPEYFNKLHAMELWSDPQADLNPHMVRQLLLFSPTMTNLLFKGCEIVSDKLMDDIWKVNPMKKLSHLTLDHCHSITSSCLLTLLDAENELAVLRIWSCKNITKPVNIDLIHRIRDENLDVYLEWFDCDD